MENKSKQEKLNTPLAEKTQNEGGRYAMNDKKPPKNKWLGVIYIVLSAFCFSLMSVFVRLAGDLPTFQKALFRNLVAAIVAFFALLKSGSFTMQKGTLPALIARSVAGTIGIVGNFYAIDNMNISAASILNKLAPFFSIIFSAILLKEKASVKDWILVAVAFVGAVFVVKPSFDFSQSLPALVGVLGGLGAGLAYTFVHYLGGKGERTAVIVFYFSVFSCLAVLPMVILDHAPMTWGQVGFLLLAGCAASGAQFSVTAAYSCAPAKEISVYDYSQVLFTALWGAIFFTEFPDWLSAIGYAVIIGAAVLKYVLTNFKKK